MREFNLHASITVVLTPTVKIVKIRRQFKLISLCPVRERQKTKAGKNMIGSNETMIIWEEKKEEKKKVLIVWRDFFFFNIGLYKVIIHQANYSCATVYASHIVPKYCHLWNLWEESYFCSGKNWDTDIGAKGITCFILCWSPSHTHLLLFIQP